MALQASRFDEIVASSATISDKIRALHAAGLSRSEIATRLNRRYQHVRNVLVNDQRRAADSQSAPERDLAPASPVSAQATTAACEPTGVFTLTVEPSGALVVPALVLAAVGAGPRDRVVVEFGPGEARLMTVATAARRAQELVANLVPADRDLVGELIAERTVAGAKGE